MSVPAIPNKTMLTPQEVADFLRVSLKTVYQCCKRGELVGARQVGSVWRIPRDAVIGQPPKPNH